MAVSIVGNCSQSGKVGDKPKYEVVQAEVGGRRVNVYFPIDGEDGLTGKVIIGSPITDEQEPVFGKAGLLGLITSNKISGVIRRTMTPRQIAEEDNKLRAYQVLTESNGSLFIREARVILSNGAARVKGAVGSAIGSGKDFYDNHHVGVRRTFITTASAIAVFCIQNYYFNIVGMVQGYFQGGSATPNVGNE